MLYDFTRNNKRGYGFLQKTSPANGSLYHPGIDYNWGNGDDDKYQPVVSPTWGVVEYVSPIGTNGGLGNYIVIYHPHNGPVWTRCLHLDSIIVRKGETVYPNQIIGYLGDTGTSSSHLHAEVLNDKGIEYIRNSKRPYGAYTRGLSLSAVKGMWIDPEHWINTQNHYVGPSLQERMSKAQNALRWARGMRRTMIQRLMIRIENLLNAHAF